MTSAEYQKVMKNNQITMLISLATVFSGVVVFLFGTFATVDYVDKLNAQNVDQLTRIEMKVDKLADKIWFLFNESKKEKPAEFTPTPDSP